MSKRIKRAKNMSAIERALICPLCESRVRVVDFKTALETTHLISQNKDIYT